MHFPFYHFRRIPKRLKPPSVIGLTLTEETRHGYDVRLEIPSGILGRPRVFFIQYKLAHHSNFSTKAGSLFKGHNRSPRPHCLFGINNNSTRDQHIKLRAIANNPIHRNSVFYALPRIPTTSAFCAWVGRLSHLTTWLRVDEIDFIARNQGIIIQKGQSHKLAVSYNGFFKEIRSDPLNISGINDVTPEYVAEFTSIRLFRILLSFQSLLKEYQSKRVHIDWNELFREYLINHARYWSVNSDYFGRIRQDYIILNQEEKRHIEKEHKNYLNFYYSYLQESGFMQGLVDDIFEADNARREKIVSHLFEALWPYYQFLSNDEWIHKTIPEPSIVYSSALANDNIISIKWDGMEEPVEINVDGIPYQLI